MVDATSRISLPALPLRQIYRHGVDAYVCSYPLGWIVKKRHLSQRQYNHKQEYFLIDKGIPTIASSFVKSCL